MDVVKNNMMFSKIVKEMSDSIWHLFCKDKLDDKICKRIYNDTVEIGLK